MSWNRPKENAPVVKSGLKEKTRPAVVKGLVGGALVVVCAVAAFLFFKSSDNAAQKEEGKHSTKIKEVAPAVVAQTAKPEPPKVENVRRTKKGTPIPASVKPDANGILRFPSGLRWVDTNDLHMVRHPQPRDLFKYRSENAIQTILSLDPTRMAPFLVGQRPKYDQRFVEDFKKSLTDIPVLKDENDTPAEKELRQAVIETKKELAAALSRGEDIAQIMNDTQAELDRLCAYNETLRQQLNEIERDGKYTDDDVRDFVTAANQMLEKEGITKIAMPSLRHRQARLAMMREREARLKKEKKQ